MVNYYFRHIAEIARFTLTHLRAEMYNTLEIAGGNIYADEY